MTPDDKRGRTPKAGKASGRLPGLLGIEWTDVAPERVRARFTVGEQHMAHNGYLHAASIVALADSACGFGCAASLPEGATGFTTLELKSNFLSTARVGDAVACEARLAHGGRTTQVWDAEVRHAASGKTIALFRCTQMVLYPRPAGAA
jgi:uncharacterized protein (TIGR00369 family)